MGLRELFLFLVLSIFSPLSFSQAYPDKAVRVIISFTPGSSTDIVGRIVMAKVASSRSCPDGDGAQSIWCNPCNLFKPGRYRSSPSRGSSSISQRRTAR